MINGTAYLLYAGVLFLTWSALSAFAVDVPRLPSPAFADREVSGGAALPETPADGQSRTFLLTLSFAATPSNNVEVSLGRDADPADGRLGAAEADLVTGWDCGEWFVRPRGLRERRAFRPAQSGGRRTLTLLVRTDTQGTPQSAVFKDGASAFAFDGLDTAPVPDWLDPRPWNRLRVTARGADIPEESVKAVFAPDGAKIIIR